MKKYNKAFISSIIASAVTIISVIPSGIALADSLEQGKTIDTAIVHGINQENHESSMISKEESFERAKTEIADGLYKDYGYTEDDYELNESSASGEIVAYEDGGMCWEWNFTYTTKDLVGIPIMVTIDAYSGELNQLIYFKVGSQSAAEEFVERLYNICLNRTPDAEGFSAWKNVLLDKTAGGMKVAYGFVFSKEFQNLNLSNHDYVTCLYKAILGREPDSAGSNAWEKALEDGHSRLEIFNGFAESIEFSNLCNSMGIKV